MRKIVNKICIILALMSVAIDITIYAILVSNPIILVSSIIFEIVLITLSIMYYYGNVGTESSKWPSRKT